LLLPSPENILSGKMVEIKTDERRPLHNGARVKMALAAVWRFC